MTEETSDSGVKVVGATSPDQEESTAAGPPPRFDPASGRR